MKFKPGDKVRVREDLEVGNYYDGIYFASRMEKYKGQIINIEGIACDDDVKVYRYDGWSFVDEMLEPVKEEKKMKFKPGDKVRVKDIISNTHGIGEKTIAKHRGKICTVSRVRKCEYETTYKLIEDGVNFDWFADMLEPVMEEKIMRNIDVIVNDKKLKDISVCRACYKLKNNMYCDSDVSCLECEFNNNETCYKFLAEEYKAPKIKLSKFEYDLLVTFNFREDYCTFNYFDQLRALKEKGYFKNVTDTSMKIKDILDNCEVDE